MSNDKDWNDIGREQGPERSRETFNEEIKQAHAREQAGNGVPPPPPPPPPPTRIDWRKLALRGDDGGLLPVVQNAHLAIVHDPALCGAVAYDEMLCAPVLCHAIGHPQAIVNPLRPVTDEDLVELQRYLQRAGLTRIGGDTVRDAMREYARHQRAFHPVRDYLSGLIWDKTPRLGLWLTIYLGADDNEYTRGIGRMFPSAWLRASTGRDARLTTCSCSKARKAS